MIGLFADPAEGGFCRDRDVMYCSAAALLLRRAAVGPALFDPVFAPAYCEDADLCLRLIAGGHRVRYVHDAMVVHHLSVSTNRQSVARRLMKTNPRLAPERAEWLAQHWAREDAPGQWRIQGHPAHRIPSAQLYRADEVQEIHKCISAPTLAVEATDSDMEQWWNGSYTMAQYHQRIQVVQNLTIARVDHAGHMLHHDQPEAVAALIEGFIA